MRVRSFLVLLLFASWWVCAAMEFGAQVGAQTGAPPANEARAALMVTVLDASGQPVEKAFVNVDPDAEGQRPSQTVATNKEGYAELKDVPGGPGWVSIRKHPLRKVDAKIELAPGSTQDLTVTLIRGGSVRLTAATSPALPNCHVHASVREPIRETGMRHQSGKLDAQGGMQIDGIRCGERVTVHVTADGHIPVEVEVAPLADEELRDLGVVTLSRGAIVRGTVHDEQGTPIVGVKYSVLGREQLCSAQGKTGDRGDFEASGFAPGVYAIWLHSKDHDDPRNTAGSSGDFNREIKLAEDETLDVDLGMRRTRVHEVLVRNGTGEPLNFATILVRSLSEPEFTFSAYTDKQGQGGLPTIPEGRFVLDVRHERQSREFTLESVAELPKEIVFASTATVVVRLTGELDGLSVLSLHDENQPVSGKRDDCLATAIVADNSATFASVGAGTYRLCVSAWGFQRTASQEVTLREGETTTLDFEIAAEPMKSYLVRVENAEGAGISGAQVELTGCAATTTDAAGEARFESRTPCYGLQVTAEGFAAHQDHRESPLQAGTLEVVLQVEAGFAIKVAEANGQPASGVRVTLYRTEGTGSGYGTTDSNGYVRIAGLAGGEWHYLLQREAGSLHVDNVVLESGRTVSEHFTIGKAITLQGVVSRNGEPLAGGLLDVFHLLKRNRSTTRVDPDGTYRIVVLEPGDYRAVYNGERGGEFMYTDVTVLESGAVDVDFRFYKVRGRLLDADGAPVAGAAVLCGGGAVTESDGRFVIENVPARCHQFAVPRPPVGAWIEEEWVKVDGDLEIERKSLRTHRVTLQCPGEREYTIRCGQKQLATGTARAFDIALPEGKHRLVAIGPYPTSSFEPRSFAYFEVSIPSESVVRIPELILGFERVLSASVYDTRVPQLAVAVTIDSLDAGTDWPWKSFTADPGGLNYVYLPVGRYRITSRFDRDRVKEQIVKVAPPVRSGDLIILDISIQLDK